MKGCVPRLRLRGFRIERCSNSGPLDQQASRAPQLLFVLTRIHICTFLTPQNNTYHRADSDQTVQIIYS